MIQKQEVPCKPKWFVRDFFVFYFLCLRQCSGAKPSITLSWLTEFCQHEQRFHQSKYLMSSYNSTL